VIAMTSLPSQPVPFRSILFDESENPIDVDGQNTPDFFADLHLDQIIGSLTAGRDEYSLNPFFCTPLRHLECVHYRHGVFRDLEVDALHDCIQSFGEAMRTMRACLDQAERRYYKYQKQRWFLSALEIYCCGVSHLESSLAGLDLRSRGFLAFREYLMNYIASSDFTSLSAAAKKLKNDLGDIRYALHIDGKRIEVRQYNSEPNYSEEVLHTFEKFRQGAAKNYQFDLRSGLEMNHVEAAVLDLVAQLHGEIFSSLDTFRSRYSSYLDATIARFDREIQFYMAWLEYLERFKQAGLSFCYPTVSDRSKEVYGREVFDLALAGSLIPEKREVVTNDFYLKAPERILVVSGPNQGGKTTFARIFGQLHYLASIGCPLPGTEARLFLFDRLFTHFEREENIQNLRGKLEDDLVRIHQILELATGSSILIMNESFLSTTLSDALFLSKEIMQRIIERGMLCVCVTFLDELASLNESTVSMLSTVNSDDPARRTFKIVRKPADGLAYAMAIAEKYELTYDKVKDRIAANAERRIAS
jgi:DNA mismatch repair protein MutS